MIGLNQLVIRSYLSMAKNRGFTLGVQYFCYWKNDLNCLNKSFGRMTSPEGGGFGHAVVARRHETLAVRRLAKRKCEPN